MTNKKKDTSFDMVEDPELLAAAEKKLAANMGKEDQVIIANLEATKGYDEGRLIAIVAELNSIGIRANYYDSSARLAFDAVSIFVIKVPISQQDLALEKIDEIIKR